MKQSGLPRTRAMSNSTTPSVARAGGMISASAAISSSRLSVLEWTLKRRMTMAPPVGWDGVGAHHALLARASRLRKSLVTCTGRVVTPEDGVTRGMIDELHGPTD